MLFYGRDTKLLKGFTLVELMIVILIVAILAAISVPILRGNIDKAKWSEGKTVAGALVIGIRTWSISAGSDGSWDEKTLPPEKLGFTDSDLQGIYFDKSNYKWQVSYYGGQLDYTITVTKPGGITEPEQMTLNSSGQWSP